MIDRTSIFLVIIQIIANDSLQSQITPPQKDQSDQDESVSAIRSRS